MDLCFDKLIDINIKRLTRPKFKHEVNQFSDPLQFQMPVEDEYAGTTDSYTIPPGINQINRENVGTHMHDIAYDGMSTDMNLSYYSNFGKIYKGEQFKTILVIMNVSALYKLTQVKIIVRTSRTHHG